ncbi:helix-turn-helix transcriptional regulator [Pyxidicoccus fallax]|uniref:Helix-turn-helix transcriptional regulator n=1 Tax=Pyxidicoccus fallax TaxID=394095 RepID=A0A848LHZ8_9BACT|nr:AraC family transcriptional regulator [Pyxidicoccus fallax]NMO16868.1 helix-turn-helix transcriptional regulator [Pyxidicoccus fallax]NPC84269.1 helix-turn-helix transcriptional regulator [Pyxidicoccus fallax]
MKRAAVPTISLWSPPHLPDLQVSRVEKDTRLWSGHCVQYGVSVLYEGAFDFWYRRRVWTHGPGRSLKLKEPGEVHRDVLIRAPVTAQSVSFAPQLVDEAARQLGLPGSPHLSAVLSRGTGRVEASALALHAALARQSTDRLECESLLAGTLEALLTEYAERATVASCPPHRPAARRARDMLHERFTENVGLEALAREVGLNRFHLLRVFRDEYGLPPHEYVTHLRVARAKELLARGVPAGEAAVEVGVYDQSQLNRHFKRIVGLTPGQYARAVSP